MSSKIILKWSRHKGAWTNRIQQKEVEKVWPPPLSLILFVISRRFIFDDKREGYEHTYCLKHYDFDAKTRKFVRSPILSLRYIIEERQATLIE